MSDASVSREECEFMAKSPTPAVRRLARAHLELLSEVEELRRDKERLDYLDANSNQFRIFKIYGMRKLAERTAREAIDAAMLPDPPEGK